MEAMSSATASFARMGDGTDFTRARAGHGATRGGTGRRTGRRTRQAGGTAHHSQAELTSG